MPDDLESTCRRYLNLSNTALEKLQISAPKDSYMEVLANDFLTMIRGYLQDAVHFYEKGELVKCISAINYAYGWIDSGARIGLFDVKGDHVNFTLYR